MFKQLFLDSLGIEKERILELRKYAKEQREQRAKKQKDELESIENLYPIVENSRDVTNIRPERIFGRISTSGRIFAPTE